MGNPHAELLKEILVYDQRGSASRVAEVAGLAYRTVMDQTDGKINPSVEVLKAAWIVTGDPRLKKILEPDGWELVRRDPDARPTKSVEAEANDYTIAKARMLEVFRRASEDGRFETREILQVEKSLAQMDKEHQEIKARVRMDMGAAE